MMTTSPPPAILAASLRTTAIAVPLVAAVVAGILVLGWLASRGAVDQRQERRRSDFLRRLAAGGIPDEQLIRFHAEDDPIEAAHETLLDQSVPISTKLSLREALAGSY